MLKLTASKNVKTKNRRWIETDHKC
jgi:hypothetical protein